MKGIKNLGLHAGLVVLLVLASSQILAGNTYYRWSDERGNPVHSDRPPPEGTEYEVVTSGTSLVRKVAADEGAVPAEADPRPGNEFDRYESGEVEPPKKNPEYCKRAQDNLATLESAARVRIRDDQGEYRYLTQDEKETEKAKARDLIAVHCE